MLEKQVLAALLQEEKGKADCGMEEDEHSNHMHALISVSFFLEENKRTR